MLKDRSKTEIIAKKIIPVEIEDQMRKSYLAYAMSVIVGRALPDVRDGLKPVHRRILYAMSERGWRHDKSYVKSAKIVGEVIGNFHPHGDSAVYDTMVRMAQNFSMRVELIDGQGNFGSVDGDPPAAYRYTEARLTEMSEQLLSDLDKQTVDFTPNFDGSRKEPLILPAAWPSLLVNGSSGIAVGMATKIPPHNLGEVVSAIDLLIQKPEVGVSELMNRIPAPDFPTGGVIIGKDGLKSAYETGKGSITIRSVSTTEEISKNKQSIVITEIPYEVKKNDLIIKIADLVNNKKIEGISEIRDESDRRGMRIVIFLKKDIDPQIILNQLYKKTNAQVSYGIIFLALVDRTPKLLNLKQILEYYIKHRKEIITRRTKYELEQAEKRAHILEGLKIALDAIDLIIKLIRSSETVTIAREGLIKKFKLTEIQANAILEMRLQKLTSLESKKIVDELLSLRKVIQNLKEILSSEVKIMGLVQTELATLKKKFHTQRKTEISIASTEILSFDNEDLISNENEVITLTEAGYIRRVPLETFRRQQRGGKGVISGGKKEDALRHTHSCLSHDLLLFFSNRGKVFYIKAYEIPETNKDSRGKNIRSLLANLMQDEYITTILDIQNFLEEKFLVLLTKKGIIKKMKLSQLKNAKKSGILAVQFKANEKDYLVDAIIVSESNDVFLGTSHGLGVRTPIDKIRAQGRVASGIIGMSLDFPNKMIGLTSVQSNQDQLFVITEQGYGKRVQFQEFTAKGRGGKGMKFSNITQRTGKVVAVHKVHPSSEAIVITNLGMTLRTPLEDISIQSRSSAGVKVLDIKGNDKVVDASIFKIK